ncbi:rod shape-determining protein MreD [Clostridium cochlearium]|jgi:rod shape-determining protein MreD|uniref:Rod shape-determining protein MreD n=1 Tax=Clostridium cochlearium TaxID=1494 RepID=A0A240APH3_CLOCO|nr:rod shape-determining protein MreD [Clostridium cochlearium]MBE6064664.1 rod shape-determining protein MreD [Clostridium cochlearium]MCR1971630.1 rod shape-determining protein MreD [Clostridium cochlearium]MDU1442016.1 rod shape-determining protein MreD [Clostridium cochlearium]NOH15772.1 rod shape-determining protein MreD [Clostridium cochlearium]SNV85270.1 rod shape determining protein MreD [Clostridium cochlearium]
MKKVATLFCIVTVLIILDNSFIPFFSIKGFYPSLTFIFIISYSIINGIWSGIWIGIFSGLLQDLHFIGAIGVNAFTNMICCILAAFIGENIFREKLVIPVLSEFLLSLLKGLILFIILYALNMKLNVKSVLISGIYNMIISIVVYKLTLRLCSLDYMQKDWKF